VERRGYTDYSAVGQEQACLAVVCVRSLYATCGCASQTTEVKSAAGEVAGRPFKVEPYLYPYQKDLHDKMVRSAQRRMLLAQRSMVSGCPAA